MIAIISSIGGYANHIGWLCWLHDKFNDQIGGEKIDQTKEEFIRKSVYNEKRTWHNWLKYEWTYRMHLDGIRIGHNVEDYNLQKKILCTVDPDIAYKNYLKFNSSLNNVGKEWFLKEVQDINNQFNDHLGLVLDNSSLLQDTLDKNIYYKICDYLELEDKYNQANRIHKSWYVCQKRSEWDFLQEVTDLYG